MILQKIWIMLFCHISLSVSLFLSFPPKFNSFYPHSVNDLYSNINYDTNTAWKMLKIHSIELLFW